LALSENAKRAYTIVMTSTNITLVIWSALLLMPAAIAAARGGPYGIASWALASLLIGWHPTGWILLTMLAITWRQRDPEPESFAWVPALVTMG
jgi:hypothetical protein